MARPTWRVRDEPKLGAGSGHASKDSVGKLERITPLGVRSQPELASESSKRVQTGEPTQFTKMSWRASGPSPSSSCKSIPNPGRRSPHSWTNGSIIRRSGGRLGWPVRKPQMPAFCRPFANSCPSQRRPFSKRCRNSTTRAEIQARPRGLSPGAHGPGRAPLLPPATPAAARRRMEIVFPGKLRSQQPADEAIPPSAHHIVGIEDRNRAGGWGTAPGRNPYSP